MDPGPFLRGCAWPPGAGAAYPRADPADHTRLPIDTWETAQLPVGVRLELVGDAGSVEVGYHTATGHLGYRGQGAGRSFSVWQGEEKLAEVPADLGDSTAVVPLGDAGAAPDRASIVYLPEGMKPSITWLAPRGGAIGPGLVQPRWLSYGDSICEGWIASEPALAWPAIAGRVFGLDTVNLGYAGSARGEIASAEQLAALASPAVISISHGTNCWSRIPHSADMMRATTAAFLEIVRQGHPAVPVVVASPVVRPDAERTPNRLGATLADLRAAIEDVVRQRIEGGDGALTLVPGRPLLDHDHLADGIHPGDDGHRILAERIGREVAAAALSQEVA